MSEAEEISRAFYAELGVEGLANMEHRVEWGLVEGILNPHYRHDERSFRRICDAAGVSRFRVFEREWAVRQRLFLRLDKPRS